MNEILRDILSARDLLPWVESLLALWLLYRFSGSHPALIARRARRLVVQSLAPAPSVDIDAALDQLEELLNGDVWRAKAMNSWRKKSIDSALDELVDAARASGLSASESMAEFAEVRREFHEAAQQINAGIALGVAADSIQRAARVLAAEVRYRQNSDSIDGALAA